MLETYLNIENPDIVRTEQFIKTFSVIFSDIHQMFRHIKGH